MFTQWPALASWANQLLGPREGLMPSSVHRILEASSEQRNSSKGYKAVREEVRVNEGAEAGM